MRNQFRSQRNHAEESEEMARTREHGSAFKRDFALEEEEKRKIAGKGKPIEAADKRCFSKDHELAFEDRQASGGNFAKDVKRTPEALKSGARHSRGSTYRQHVRAGERSHKSR